MKIMRCNGTKGNDSDRNGCANGITARANNENDNCFAYQANDGSQVRNSEVNLVMRASSANCVAEKLVNVCTDLVVAFPSWMEKFISKWVSYTSFVMLEEVSPVDNPKGQLLWITIAWNGFITVELNIFVQFPNDGEWKICLVSVRLNNEEKNKRNFGMNRTETLKKLVKVKLSKCIVK